MMGMGTAAGVASAMTAISKQEQERKKAQAFARQFQAEVEFGFRNLQPGGITWVNDKGEVKFPEKPAEKLKADAPLPTMKDLPGYEEPKRSWSWLWVVLLIVSLAGLFQWAH